MNKLVSMIGLAAISASLGMIGACSSSSSDDSAAGGDSGADTSATHDSGVVDTGIAADTGSGNPDDTCTAMSTAATCQKCCGTNHASGGTVATNAAIACACHDTGVDGGADAGVDGGAGPCAAACAATLCASTPATP
ncbi:MAG: hypothetical protein ABI183_02855, partial [Polyangiaceae bacterium]